LNYIRIRITGEKNRVRQVANLIESGFPLALEKAGLGEVVAIETLISIDGRESGATLDADIIAPAGISTILAMNVLGIFSRYIQSALHRAGIPLLKLGAASWPIRKRSKQDIIATRFIRVETGMFAQDLVTSSPPRPRPGTSIVRG